jgi:hypothetical protein
MWRWEHGVHLMKMCYFTCSSQKMSQGQWVSGWKYDSFYHFLLVNIETAFHRPKHHTRVKLLWHFYWELAQLHMYLTTPQNMLMSPLYITPTYQSALIIIHYIKNIGEKNVPFTFKLPNATVWVHICTCEVYHWPFCTSGNNTVP